MILKKESRIKILKKLLIDLQDLRNNYVDASPAWILIHAAQGHLDSIRHLEQSTNFDDESLGVKME